MLLINFFGIILILPYYDCYFTFIIIHFSGFHFVLYLFLIGFKKFTFLGKEEFLLITLNFNFAFKQIIGLLI